MTSIEIKKILKANGINTKLVSVSKTRSFINVRLLSYEISKVQVEKLLSHLDTCRNVSCDMDSIYIGITVDVRYHYQAEVPEFLRNAVIAAREFYYELPKDHVGRHAVSEIILKKYDWAKELYGSPYIISDIQRLI